MANKKKVCVFLASGMEEMEAIILIDVLRRGGIEVTTYAGEKAQHIHSGLPIQPENLIQASRNTWHLADKTLEGVKDEEFLEYDMILFPGGLQGTNYWNSHPRTPSILRLMQSQKKWIGAICAAPKILLTHQILIEGDRYTAYPKATEEKSGYSGKAVEVLKEKKIITSKGPGTAFLMALQILEELVGTDIKNSVENGLQFPNE